MSYYTFPDVEITDFSNSNCSYQLNDLGVWEMYIEGAPYERGVLYGELCKDQMKSQECHLVTAAEQIVPNVILRKLLSYLIALFNRNFYNHIPIEYVEEIYGTSHACSDDYDYIGPKFIRALNYHAAHDLGHALNDYSIVGCTSFGILDTTDTKNRLLIGRNFDFYFGDEFSQEKLILFMKPDNGYAFCSYAWAGFMGVVSGMNEKGLSVSINASKSIPPTSAKTPISILAREILQYASNIDEAIEIASKREVFVSESIMIGSKEDTLIAIIEKGPEGMGIYNMQGNRIICSNHYQSEKFAKSNINLENMAESDSQYRYSRVAELVPENGHLTIEEIAEVLRDQNGPNGDTLGMANPRALNQLLAHHAVIFDNINTSMYISSNPWQLGEFRGYRLNEIFETKEINYCDTISASSFLKSYNYELFLEHDAIRLKLQACLSSDTLSLNVDEISRFIATNSESFATYELLGNYYSHNGFNSKAIEMYDLALNKLLPSVLVQERISNQIILNTE